MEATSFYTIFGVVTVHPVTLTAVISMIISILLLACSAVISASEVAFFSMDPQVLNELEESERKPEKQILRLLNSPQRLLATMLIGNNFVNVAIILLLTQATSSIFNFNSAPVVGFIFQSVIITFLLLLFGEIMDGVLFDSMKHHATAWVRALHDVGLTFTREEAFMNEGRTGHSTINEIFNRVYGRDATEDEKHKIYKLKSDYFDECGPTERMPYALDLLQKIKDYGSKIFVVTGSGQPSLIDNLQHFFPDIFEKGKMVTAFDVKHGKPHPEPYLIALDKSGVQPWEAVVVENAPLGVASASAARLFTIGVNTGPLEAKVLSENGADIVLDSMFIINPIAIGIGNRATVISFHSGLVGTLIVLIINTVAITIGHRATVVFGHSWLVGTLIVVIIDTITITIRHRATVVFSYAWLVGAFVHIIGNAIPIAILYRVRVSVGRCRWQFFLHFRHFRFLFLFNLRLFVTP